LIDIISKSNIFSKSKYGKLYHHSRSFIGCFSIYPRNSIDWVCFKQWKEYVNTDVTKSIADNFIPFITNIYDYITTAPPSGNRDLNNYCCFKLCEIISEQTKIPFVISFAKREHKKYHGAMTSITSEPPQLLESFKIENSRLLWIDDFLTSGRTAKWCYEILKSKNNHVDGLIFAHWGTGI